MKKCRLTWQFYLPSYTKAANFMYAEMLITVDPKKALKIFEKIKNLKDTELLTPNIYTIVKFDLMPLIVEFCSLCICT